MTETAGAQSYADVEKALLARWPESKIDPTLDRIRDRSTFSGAAAAPTR